MGKSVMHITRGMAQGRCRACHDQFVGPGDRCQPCREKLREHKRRKRR